jgi:predicted  nucleic acid-binding Zn-ribbon protein
LALVNAGKTLQPVAPVAIANKTANVVKPKSILDKVIGDPKQFVAEIQNLDPTALRTIITLLEDLLTTSEEREDALNNAVSDADNAVSDAANGVADAEDVLTGKQQGVADAEAHLTTTQEQAAAAVEAAEAALAAAQQAETEAQGSLNDAKADHTQKVDAKSDAEDSLAGEVDGLNHEQQVLREVIAILENLHSANLDATLSLDNWEAVNGATIDAGVATCNTNTGSCNIITKGEFTRPLEISWTSKLLPGQGDECVVMDVFPQTNGRHSGYSMGYGWWANHLGYGLNSASAAGGDGDISVNHVYKMVLTDTQVQMWQDDNMYHSMDSTTYMSGKIRIGQSCRNFEVSDVTVTNL